MSKAMYPGSFDPITIGHLDIIKRASALYDEVVVAIMYNSQKRATFDPLERKQMIERCTADLKNVKVIIGDGLTVDVCQKNDCQVLIRGIRAIADYEYELALASANMKLAPSIETVFLVAKPEYSFLSSSIAKEIAHYGGDIEPLIPAPILDAVSERLK